MRSTIRIRLALAAGVMLAAAPPLAAQGAPAQRVQVKASVLEAMTAQKPRSKAPKTARAGMKPAPKSAAASTSKSGPPAPTSVRAVTPASR